MVAKCTIKIGLASRHTFGAVAITLYTVSIFFMRPDPDARFQVDGVPTHVPNYIHRSWCGLWKPLAIMGRHRCWGDGPPASRDPIARFQGRCKHTKYPGERDNSYIHDTSKKCMILTSGVKGVHGIK